MLNMPLIKPTALMKAACLTLLKHPIIVFPFFLLSSLQVLILEILYFVPRYPLNQIFNPILVKAVPPTLLHYPYNFILLAQWFHRLEVFISLFISSFFYGAVILVVALINNDEKIIWKEVFDKARRQYLHLVMTVTCSVILLAGLSFVHGLLLKKILIIKSTSGFLFLIKQGVMISTPIVQVFCSALVVALMGFMMPLIIIEEKKFLDAFRINWQQYRHFFGLIFGVTLLSGILFLPLLFLRVSLINDLTAKVPELSAIFMVLSIVMTLFIDAIQYTAITLCYLFVKEQKT